MKCGLIYRSPKPPYNLGDSSVSQQEAELQWLCLPEQSQEGGQTTARLGRLSEEERERAANSLFSKGETETMLVPFLLVFESGFLCVPLAVLKMLLHFLKIKIYHFPSSLRSYYLYLTMTETLQEKRCYVHFWEYRF